MKDKAKSSSLVKRNNIVEDEEQKSYVLHLLPNRSKFIIFHCTEPRESFGTEFFYVKQWKRISCFILS